MTAELKVKSLLFKYVHLLAFAMAVLLFQIGKLKPDWVDQFYLDGFYSVLQKVHFEVFSKLPFDLTDVLIVLLMIKLLRTLIRRKNKSKKKHPFTSLVNTVSIILTSFLILWGFNYAGRTFQEKVGFQTAESPPSLDNTIQKCIELRKELPNKHYHQGLLTASDITKIDGCINSFFEDEYPEYLHQATIKKISNTGWLRSIGISGIYFPFSLQGHVDASFTRHQLLFTCAHELSHAHGITDEGEANLIAYLSLANSSNKEYQFAAEFTLLRYSLKSEEEINTLPQLLIDDYQILKSNREKYPPFFPELSSATNNLFLHLMGVEDGVQSYNHFPLLLQGYNMR